MQNEIQAFTDLIKQYESEITLKERELNELKRKLKILRKAAKDWEGETNENNDKQTEI